MPRSKKQRGFGFKQMNGMTFLVCLKNEEKAYVDIDQPVVAEICSDVSHDLSIRAIMSSGGTSFVYGRYRAFPIATIGDYQEAVMEIRKQGEDDIYVIALFPDGRHQVFPESDIGKYIEETQDAILANLLLA